MKRIFYCIASVAFIYSHAFAEESKIYISSKDIMVAENGIFVKVDGYVSKTKQLFYDDIGPYITDFEAVKCPKCGREYPAYERHCPYREMHDDDHNK